jgi:ATP-dependent Zn protease
MDAWWRAVISWVPFLLLIGFWVYFMKKLKASRQPELVERTFQHMERVEAMLERIVVAVEKTT